MANKNFKDPSAQGTVAEDDIRDLLRAEKLSPIADTLAAGCSWARRVMEGDRTEPSMEFDPGVPEALISLLVERKDAEALSWLASVAQSPPVVKSARKALHLLRSRGMQVDKSIPLPRSLPSANVEPRRSLVTQYDPRGQRLVLVAQGQHRGSIVHQARISWRSGLLEMQSQRLSTRGIKDIVRRLDRSSLISAECETEDAHCLVFIAALRTKSLGRGLPRGYLAASHFLVGKKSADHPATKIRPDNEDLKSILKRRNFFLGWIPSREVVEKMSADLSRIQKSDLLPTQSAKARTWSEVVADSARSHFQDPRAREASRAFFLDLAHLAWEKKERELAGKLRGAADLFSCPSVGDHLLGRFFLEQLVMREGKDSPESIPH